MFSISKSVKKTKSGKKTAGVNGFELNGQTANNWCQNSPSQKNPEYYYQQAEEKHVANGACEEGNLIKSLDLSEDEDLFDEASTWDHGALKGPMNAQNKIVGKKGQTGKSGCISKGVKVVMSGWTRAGSDHMVHP